MKKIRALIKSILKEFMRNKTSIFLLIVVPLVLIMLIFISFNANGLRIIRLGYIQEEIDVNINEFTGVFENFFDLYEFKSLETCHKNLKNYKLYGCLVLSGSNEYGYSVEAHYDNTRSNVIYDVLSRIKVSIDYIKKQSSKKAAGDFLTKFRSNLNELNNFNIELGYVDDNLYDYQDDLNDAKNDLIDSKYELISTLDEMNNDITAAEYSLNSVEDDLDDGLEEMSDLIDTLNNNLNKIPVIEGYYDYQVEAYSALGSLNYYQNRLERDLDYNINNVRSRINSYKTAETTGRIKIADIDLAIKSLDSTSDDLKGYSYDIVELQNELKGIDSEFSLMKKISPETLSDPVVLINKPIYDVKNGDNNILISLQVMYPIVLLLIVLFLSLLISTFVTLGSINSEAKQRFSLIKGIFFPDFFSIYTSSMIILLVPIAAILFLGQYVFHLAISPHIGVISLLMFMLSSIFVFIGMSIAFMVKKESIALLITTFILVLLIFFSGFLLPLEKMSNFAYNFAIRFASGAVLNGFSKVVFYNASITKILPEVMCLLSWYVSTFFASLIIKKIKKE